MQLVTASRYYQELLDGITRAKKRIVLAAMVVLADGRTTPIFEAILAARQRGVAVHVFYDVYSYTWFSTSHERRAARPALVARTRAMLEELKEAGAEVAAYGAVGANPFKGRSHIKITVVDDTAFAFGGINFAAPNFDHADYMFKAESQALADELAAVVRCAPASHQDLEWPVDVHSSLLFDGGKPGSSVIYGRACELAAEAGHVWYVSQMAPSGPLAGLIRQTQSRCYFNRPSLAAPVLSASLAVDRLRGTAPNLYRRQQYIHAKFILFELKDGSKALISGSNNFSWRGIAFGTQEIALYSTDEKIWQQLAGFMAEYIA